MKACLINPPTSRPQDDIFFPMGLIAVGTVLRKMGVETEILDCDLQMRKHPELRESFSFFKNYLLERLHRSRADVFGITSLCSNFPLAVKISQALREEFPGVKIVLGGPQPSSLPLETLEHCPAVDAVVVGEAEVTVAELFASDWRAESLSKIDGLAYRDGGRVVQNKPRALLDDLDVLPMPDFDLVDLREYPDFDTALALIEAGRGCPFRCTFCSTAEMWSRKYRVKSPGRILAEMRRLNAEFGMTYFPLTHDNFTTSPKYVRKFCREFLETNTEGFTWSASARTDTVRPDDLEAMYRSGCRGLFFGVDSGSVTTQKGIDKNLDLEEYKFIIQEAVKRGIAAVASFIIGFPEESLDDINATLELGLWSKRAGVKEVQYHRLAALASTKIFHRHWENLKFRAIVSDICLLLFLDEELVREVQDHPRLYSSYYEIPVPKAEGIDLACLNNFYSFLVNAIGPSLHGYLKKRNLTPIGFFQEWLDRQQPANYGELYGKPYIMETVAECL